MDGSDKNLARMVCVFNRNRDFYQVPIALHDAGMLEALVTDFYAPEKWLDRLPARLRNLRADGLPSSATRSSLLPFLMQMLAQLAKLPMRFVFPITDHMLAMRGARLARRMKAHLYCYGNYVPPPAARGAGTKLIDFEFHPHLHMTFDLLREDAARYPQVADSFAQEERDLARARVVEAWRSADSIVCASTMTRNSLVTAGCAPEKITIIPYGCAPPRADVALRAPGPCRFLFVGQGLQRKGLHHLLLAWRRLAGKGATLTLVCYRIDPGIAALAGQEGVTLLGRQSRAELDALFAAADVFVMPSLVEGFGLTYLEALAHGCHVVGTGNTGLPDVPFSDAAKSIVAVGDPDALAECLQGLADRKAAGELDPRAIAAETAKWQWSDFRRAIGAHARDILGQGLSRSQPECFP